MSILISFFELLLYIAIIVFVAFAIRWAITSIFGWSLDADVEKWGRIIVGLLCLIAVIVWLASIFGLGGGFPHFLVVR